jgi:adenosylhomocysteine nucleosidase
MPTSPTPLTSTTPIAILSALLQEQQGLMELLHRPHKVVHAGRDFWLGELHGRPVVLALSKIGKVAAATTATALIERFGVRRMVFTGVAGGLGKDVNVGDVVVASDFVQHDLDASPLFPRYEVPLYGRTCFDGDAALTALLFKAASVALGDGGVGGAGSAFPGARVHRGLMPAATVLSQVPASRAACMPR